MNTRAGLRDRAMIETLYSTGMRVSELVSLDRARFQEAREEEGIEVAITGKGKKIRPVFFSSRAIKSICAYLATRTDTDPALFISYRGPARATKRLTAKSIEHIVKEYAGKIPEIPFTVTPHTIRHSYATGLLRAGAGLRQIQELLGHDSIATTQIYTHVTNGQLREAWMKNYAIG